MSKTVRVAGCVSVSQESRRVALFRLLLLLIALLSRPPALCLVFQNDRCIPLLSCAGESTHCSQHTLDFYDHSIFSPACLPVLVSHIGLPEARAVRAFSVSPTFYDSGFTSPPQFPSR